MTDLELIIELQEFSNQMNKLAEEIKTTNKVENGEMQLATDKLQTVYNHLQSCLKIIKDLNEVSCDPVVKEELELQLLKSLRLVIKQGYIISDYSGTSEYKKAILSLILKLEGFSFYSKFLHKLEVTKKPLEQVLLHEVYELGEVEFNNFVKELRKLKQEYYPSLLAENSILSKEEILDDGIKAINEIAKQVFEKDKVESLLGFPKGSPIAGQRELTFFPGTYVDDIKLLRCVGKKNGKYFPLGMYTIVKNGERVGEVCVQDLRDALNNSTSEANVYENKSILKHGVELPTGNSIHAQFFRLVLETVEENCDEETLAKVVEVYKSPAQFPADENYKAMLTKVWELCGTEVARRLYLKLDEANLKGCWLIRYPSV